MFPIVSPTARSSRAMVALFDASGVGQWFRYATGLIEVVSAVAQKHFANSSPYETGECPVVILRGSTSFASCMSVWTTNVTSRDWRHIIESRGLRRILPSAPTPRHCPSRRS
jgi:hypothetical protein